MQDLENLPPGTHRIEDSRGEHVVLSPQPNSDPNQPLVFLDLLISRPEHSN